MSRFPGPFFLRIFSCPAYCGNGILAAIIPVLLWVHPVFLYSQNNGSSSDHASFVQTFGKPLFIYNTFNFASSRAGKSRLDLHIAFVNDILQFVKVDDKAYRAKYELIVEMLDSQGSRQDGAIIKKAIVVNSFDETNSRTKVNRNKISFDLAPGSYKLTLELIDQDTKRHLVRNENLVLQDFEQNDLSMSDLVFVDSVEIDQAGVKNLVPNMRKTLDEPDSNFGAYFELYAHVQDSTELHTRVFDLENNPLLHEFEVLAPGQQPVRKFIPLKNLVKLPGKYILVVEARSGEKKVSARAGFFVQYTTEPLSLQSFANASALYRSLKYVAKSGDFSKIEKLPQTERAAWVSRFWKERDPTPGTESNELKEEFYRRVEFTLRNFSTTANDKPGWETDRGKIYIIYGPPSEVQRRSIDLHTNPYEVWYYKNIDKRFIFLDKSGLGDYRLVHKD